MERNTHLQCRIIIFFTVHLYIVNMLPKHDIY
jgi:hypothetical protein